MKKFLSVLLAVLLTVTCLPLTALAAETDSEETLIVAGDNAEIFGVAWHGTLYTNTMTKGEDGKYTKSYTTDKAYAVVQLKAVKNDTEWIGDDKGNNVAFAVTGPGTFTVSYDPETNIVTVSGENVGEAVFNYTDVYAVGNGEGNWLNGVSWTPDAEANKMNEVEKDVWEITFEGVPDGFERQIKFAIDGAWNYNFGAPKEDAPVIESGVTYDAAWDGGNITFDTANLCNVKAQLDLRDFDFVNKTGAKYTITIANYVCLHTHTRTVPGRAPTCTKAGLSDSKYCTSCGEMIMAQEELPALGHHPIIDHETEATCQHEGHTLGVYCDRCGEVYVPMEIIPKVPHTVVKDEAVAPTCDTAGKTEGSHCSMCGAIIVEQQVIPALGHHYVYVPAKEATYMHTGHTEGVQCDKCEKWLIATEETPLKPVDFMIGDVTGDELLTVEDITAVQRMLSEFLTADLTDEKTFLQYDFNGDGKINIKDVTAMQRKLAELE